MEELLLFVSLLMNSHDYAFLQTVFSKRLCHLLILLFSVSPLSSHSRT